MTNREIDAMVAEKVMGWLHIPSDHPYRWYNDHGGVIVEGQPQRFPCKMEDGTYGGIPNDWRPSTDIAAAWDVVEKLDLLSKCAMCRDAGEYWVDDTYSHAIQAHADTAPMAICLAALQAVGHYFAPTPQQIAEADARQARTVEGMKGREE